MAAVEIGHYRRWPTGCASWASTPAAAMAPFVAALETYHALTEPSTWLEGVVKAYVGDGHGRRLLPRGRRVRRRADPGADPRGARRRRPGRVRGARGARPRSPRSPRSAGRLALWARRLVGEAISQTQHVLAERDALMLLLVEGAGDLTGVAGLIGRITDRHAERMADARPVRADRGSTPALAEAAGLVLPKPTRRASAWAIST